MSELTPCPECQRHVRKTETRCPFCEASLSLAHLPAHVLPKRRLGRAATFAFGASVVGATALVACSDGSDGDFGGMAIYGGPPTAGAGGSFGGSAVYGAPPSGSSNGGNGAAPAAGAGNEEPGGNGGAPAAGGEGGTPSAGEGGGLTIYGGPPSGAGGV